MKKENLNRYNWDLNGLLLDETFNQTFKNWVFLLKRYKNSINKLFISPKHFQEWLSCKIKNEHYYRNIYTYIWENHYEDPKKKQWFILNKKFSKYNDEIVNIWQLEKDVVSKNEKTIKSLLEQKELKRYKRFMFINFFKSNIAVISEENLKIVKKLKGDEPIKNILDKINNDALYLINSPKCSNGQILSNWYNYDIDHSDDRVLRKNMWQNERIARSFLKNTYSEIFYWLIFRSNQVSQLKNEKDYISSILSSYEISFKQFRNILSMTQLFKKSNILFREKIENDFLKNNHFDEFYPWDEKIAFSRESTEYFSIDDTIELSKKILKILGPEYQNIVENRILKEKWIDWIHTKRLTGNNNYCCCTKNVCPISLMFQNNSYDVATVNHEIGHAVCNVLSQQNQDVYWTPNSLISEVASFVNEMITNFYLIDYYKKNSQSKYLILKNILWRFFNSVSNLPFIELFKCYLNDTYVIHKKAIKPNELEWMYIKLKKQYEGMTKNETKWLSNKNVGPLYTHDLYNYIAYSYDNFDGTKYYLGQIIGICVAHDLIKDPDKFLPNYLNFLKTGSSVDPIKAIKMLGYDFTKANVYVKANKIMEELLKQFIKLK